MAALLPAPMAMLQAAARSAVFRHPAPLGGNAANPARVSLVLFTAAGARRALPCPVPALRRWITTRQGAPVADSPVTTG
jgi:hypothetical protein